jgi:hypothetical protein
MVQTQKHARSRSRRYRCGLPTRMLAAHFAGTLRKQFVQMQKTCWRVSEIRAIFHSEAQESPGALTTKT